VAAQTNEFRDYQNPGALVPMHGDIETKFGKTRHKAAEVFNALTIGTAREEYRAPEKPARSLRRFIAPARQGIWLEKLAFGRC
jgi:hypothetical protein